MTTATQTHPRFSTNGNGDRLKREYAPQKLLDVNKVKVAPYNPKGRVSKNALRELIRSIKDHGLFYEILVTPDYTVIEGHRRLAAVKELGWDTIPTKIIHNDPEVVYSSINACSKKMTANETLGVYLANPRAAHPKMVKRLKTLEYEFDKPILRKLYEAGLSLNVFRIAKSARDYLGAASPSSKSIVVWLIETANQAAVRAGVQTGASKARLRKAIVNNEPFGFREE